MEHEVRICRVFGMESAWCHTMLTNARLAVIVYMSRCAVIQEIRRIETILVFFSRFKRVFFQLKSSAEHESCVDLLFRFSPSST